MFYYSVTLTHKLTTDLGSLELQRCTQPLPPQQHPLCLWKHQGFGYGRQIKCISQTRTQLQAMWQTERARKSRAKKTQILDRNGVSPIRLQQGFICLDLSPSIAPSAVRSRPQKKTRHVRTHASILPSYLGKVQAGSYHIPERKCWADAGVRRRERGGAARRPQVPALYGAGRARALPQPPPARPLRRLHVKSPAVTPGPPVPARGGTRLLERRGSGGFPQRIAIGMVFLLSLNYSQELGLFDTLFAKQWFVSHAGSSLASLRELGIHSQ